MTQIAFLIGTGFLTITHLEEIGTFFTRLLAFLSPHSRFFLYAESFPPFLATLLLFSIFVSSIVFVFNLVFNINPGGH